ncbi:MAG TPA: sodium:proton antiporter, partial [Natronincola sp.]|nr:sodium:proton antiporter [Natronincola sp.]
MGMIASLALLLLCGYGIGEIFNHFRLPRLLGMLLTGIALGPFALNWLHGDLLLISQPLRTIALIVILLRAGLGLKWNDLKVVGRAAIMLSFIPCIMEGTIVMIMSRTLLGFSYAEGAMLGFVLAAVSPAVVVPSMLNLKDQGYGEDKQIATLVLAGASVDDVISITLFTLFLNLSVRGEADFLV